MQCTAFHYWVMTVGAISSVGTFVAIVFTLGNWRRAHTHVFRLIEVRTAWSSGRNNVTSCRFSVYVRNLGLPARSLSVAIVFHPNGEFGNFSVPLTRFDIGGDQGASKESSFEKGSTGLFEFRSDAMKQTSLGMLKSLNFGTNHGACLCFYSDGYLVGKFRIGSPTDRLKGWWSGIANWVNCALVRKVRTPSGAEGVRIPTYLPSMISIVGKLGQFIDWIKKEPSAASPTSDDQ